jgi:hypothetical protein
MLPFVTFDIQLFAVELVAIELFAIELFAIQLFAVQLFADKLFHLGLLLTFSSFALKLLIVRFLPFCYSTFSRTI